jgi:hypothetical protein
MARTCFGKSAMPLWQQWLTLSSGGAALHTQARSSERRQLADRGPSTTGEPVLAWLSERVAKQHQAMAEFDNPRLEYRRLFSEAWGTFLLVLVAAGGGVIGATAFGADLTLAMKALAPGIMVLAIIFFMGTISGAHLNPAVTLAFAVRGNFPWLRVPGYLLAQFAGAILACLVLQWLYGGIINGATEPAAQVTTRVAVLTEMILTAGLVSVILGTASGARNIGRQRRPRRRRLHRTGIRVGRPRHRRLDEPDPLLRTHAHRRGPHTLVDLPRRPHRRSADRSRLRMDPPRPSHQGRRIRRTRNPRPRRPRRPIAAARLGAGARTATVAYD